MARNGFSHLIPLPNRGRTILDALAPSFGGKAETVELGLGWAIRNGVPRDPDFPSKPQIHVHLSEDYRTRFDPPHLGSMLLKALDVFRARVPEPYPEPGGVRYWAIDLPAATVRTIRTRCFDRGVDPDRELATILFEALNLVDQELPEMDAPLIATTPQSRKLYYALSAKARDANLDLETLLADAMRRLASKTKEDG